MKLSYFVVSLVLLCSHSVSAQLTASVERDHLLAIGLMSYVYSNWQNDENSRRGYNIGAFLVNPSANLLKGYNLNSVRSSEVRKTSHAEVGLMQELIKKGEITNLRGFYIITTLEPCMMCSGMMTFLEADSVRYIQTDPEFGKNIERLAEDYAGQPANDRCKHIKSIRAVSGYYASALEKLYVAFRSDQHNRGKSMADFLYEADVKCVYKGAYDELESITKAQFHFNDGLLDQLKQIIIRQNTF